MLYAKFQDNRTSGSEEDDLKGICKHRFCSSTDFVHIEQKWLATATEIVVLTKMVAISTDFVHFGQKW